jgi:hypothetical protein
MTCHRRPLIEAEVEHLVATALSQRPCNPGLRRDWLLCVTVLVGVSAFYGTLYCSREAPLLLVIATDLRSGGTLLGGHHRATGAPPP